MALEKLWSTPFSVTWRKALVSLPRAVPDGVLRYLSPEGPQPVVLHLSSRSTHKIPLYVFIPPAALLELHPKLPVLLDFHGGGFVLGSCQEQAPFCAKLARELGCVAISVDYRLGPYDQFPAALEDAEDVLVALLDASHPIYHELRTRLTETAQQLARAGSHGAAAANTNIKKLRLNLDTTRIAVSGFSSGGNIALNLALSVAADPPLVPHPWPSPFPASHAGRIPLLLFYPSLDCRQLPSERPRPPGLAQPSGLLASLRLDDELMPTYLPRELAAHPRASPGLAPVTGKGASAEARSGLHAQARMFLVLPELDTLAAQSEVWIEKVAAEGRAQDLTVARFAATHHGWTQMPDSFIDDESRKSKYKVFDDAVAFTRTTWEM